MNIVIAGAGDVGFHLASLLAIENQNITLIDSDQEVLDYAGAHLDVLTIRGDATSLATLENARVGSAGLMLAVTTSEKTNMMAAIIAKKLGCRRVIARVDNEEYLSEENEKTICSLGIDHVISPRQLAAVEIERLIKQCSFTDIFDFEEGKLSLLGITLDENSPLVGVRLSDIDQLRSKVDLHPIAILRGHETIIPRGFTQLKRNDHIYFITKPDQLRLVEDFVGKKRQTIKNIMILGGGNLAVSTAQLLQENYNVTIVENNKPRCQYLNEQLDNVLVIRGAYTNIDLLQEEGLDRMDAFIALTDNSETNIISCLTARNHGVFKTIAQVENKEYVHISQNIGVDTLINKKLLAANSIFRYIRKGNIEAITSLQGVDAEVIEYVISKSNQLTKKPLKDLHFPETALVGGIIRGEETLIPNGNTQMQMDDKVIVFALPAAIKRLDELFR
ncbi:Trk system potassium transporter TrkA [Neolewinella lacunae]|uniref:Trk system potassium uptake protein TrkA n=1 Tax=Neolewinella lacunae TaxID=1517758 RepID=A0A923PIV9_9BACT|nr:Trk system potassium transporter TrkA [Neolewinella lacunae]MBC6994958.1 Trk system potassium transporter TrkA [Neolewinella lacunae]MDN3633271.1 Trk system potassium transporter TrkA [Neolewinella lacunae]